VEAEVRRRKRTQEISSLARKKLIKALSCNKRRLAYFFLSIFALASLLLPELSPFWRDSGSAYAETPSSIIKDLQERSSRIEERKKVLDTRESRLNILKEELEGMLQKYILLKEEIDLNHSEEREQRRKLEEERITRLAKIYQSMPPKQAADRIGKMKESTALGLLRRIKEKVAAKILSNMSPGKATLFSEGFISAKK